MYFHGHSFPEEVDDLRDLRVSLEGRVEHRLAQPFVIVFGIYLALRTHLLSFSAEFAGETPGAGLHCWLGLGQGELVSPFQG